MWSSNCLAGSETNISVGMYVRVLSSGGGGGAWGKLPPLPKILQLHRNYSLGHFLCYYTVVVVFCTTPRKIYLSKKWGFYRSLHHFQKPSCSAQKGAYFPPPCKAMWFTVIAQIFPPPPPPPSQRIRTLYVHAWVESLHNLTQVFAHLYPWESCVSQEAGPAGTSD